MWVEIGLFGLPPASLPLAVNEVLCWLTLLRQKVSRVAIRVIGRRASQTRETKGFWRAVFSL